MLGMNLSCVHPVHSLSFLCSNQHHRFQNFIDSAYLLAEHSKQKIELLIIEWNPPAGKRRVLDAFVSFLCF